MISILLTALTENFQQPLMAPAINSSVITKLSMSLRLITTLTTQLLTVYDSINGVNDVQRRKKNFINGLLNL